MVASFLRSWARTVVAPLRRRGFTPAALREGREVLKNPCQGFYRIFRYLLSGDDPAELPRKYDLPLALLEINLCSFRTGAIGGSALAQLEDILNGWSSSGARMLLRFLYDWEGIAKAREPEALSTVLTHMDQVASIVNRHAASVYLMQGCFIGNWGELHGSRFGERSIQILMEHLHQRIDPAIYLSVRTPAQWRMVTGLYDVPAAFPPLAGRLGLYNDGMLGSRSDLGTYGETRRKDASHPAYKGTREEELIFQNVLCRQVPNGGEVVGNTPYSDLRAAVVYLKTIHCSYLNADYDQTVLQKWARTAWSEPDAFRGCDGLTYIKAHLGYRYVVRSATVGNRGFRKPRLTLTLENTGFANTLKPFEAQLLLRNTQTHETLSVPVFFDFRTLKSGQTATLTATLPGKELSKGTWQVFFSITDNATGTRIALANTTYTKETGLLLGQLDE